MYVDPPVIADFDFVFQRGLWPIYGLGHPTSPFTYHLLRGIVARVRRQDKGEGKKVVECGPTAKLSRVANPMRVFLQKRPEKARRLQRVVGGDRRVDR